jgi:hypothetical protein
MVHTYSNAAWLRPLENEPDCPLVISIIPLNQPRLLTTERLKRAARTNKPTADIKYSTFYSLCKVLHSPQGSQRLYINNTPTELHNLSRVWNQTINKTRIVIETIFTYNDMPLSITSFKDSIPYLQGGEHALAVLTEYSWYTTLGTTVRPYRDKDIRRRTSLSTNSKGEVVLSYHLKQWAAHYLPVQGYMNDDSPYTGSVSTIDALSAITTGTKSLALPVGTSNSPAS